MAYFFRFVPPSEGRCTMNTPLEAQYRTLYAQIEKSRQPPAWKLHLLRHAYTYMKVICLIHLIVNLLDVIYIFSGTAYITSFFTCSYDKETVKDPVWKIIEKVIKALNYGSHGFFPFPYIYTYTEYYMQFEQSYCGTDMFMIPWKDLVNFAGNCMWLTVTVLRFHAVRTKDLVNFELIYLTHIMKIFLEFPDPGSTRYELDTSYNYNFMNLPHIFILIAVVYMEYLYICKLKSESEEMRNKCLGLQLLLRYRGELSEEEKDFEETMKYIPESMIHGILDV